MIKIHNFFKIECRRPLNNLNVVSIAEIAQYTDFDHNVQFPVAEADKSLRENFWYEVDSDHDLNSLTFKSFTIFFKDGSSLVATV